MKNKLAVLFMLMSFGMFAGCNTIEGVGRDVERGGEKLQDTAKDTKQKM